MRNFLKTVSAMLAVLMLIFALAACHAEEEAQDTVSNTETEAEAEAPTEEGGNDESEYDGYTLNGVPLEGYKIYYAWRNSTDTPAEVATAIADAIETATGIRLKTVRESSSMNEYAIVVGDSEGALTAESCGLADKEYCIAVSEKKICFLSSTDYGLLKLTEKLGTIFDGKKAIEIESTSKLSYKGLRFLESMTFNIYNWDSSSAHLAAIKSVIKNFTPDTIGFQEITATWINKLMQDSTISSMYAYVGKDRGDNTHEQAAIFYRKDRFTLVDSGTKWLYGDEPTGSDIPGSLNGTEYYRVFTYAVLERNSDGKRITHINTHLDTSAHASYEDQATQVGYALAMVEKLIKDYGVAVTVFTGDFNADMEKPACVSILDAGFVHAGTESHAVLGMEQGGELYTNNQNNTTKGVCSYIDHIFVKADNVWLEEYEICDQKYNGNYPSDHLPRIARYLLQ